MPHPNEHVTEHERAIMLRHPGLFGPPPWLTSQTPMGWGFCCGSGWHPILERLFDDIDRIVAEEGITVSIVQIKEKFGGLRVYARPCPEKVGQRIRIAEQEAARTCEGCGGPSEIRNRGGYYTTQCDRCNERRTRGQGG